MGISSFTPSHLLSHTVVEERSRSRSAVSVQYAFVNNVRFLSMAAVVWMHCIGMILPSHGTVEQSSLWLLLIQPAKFGTIGFFLISGFLMGEGLTRRSRLEYISRRINTVARPWLAWFLLLFLLQTLNRVIKGPSLLSSIPDLPTAWNMLQQELFQTPYWFVPNLLLSICVLLACRRYIDRLWFGGLLFSVSVFYGLNIHSRWLSISSHTEAMFGFAFYLWLGIWASRHCERARRLVDNLPVPLVLIGCIIAFIGSLTESKLLLAAGFADALDTLRLTNQLFSLAMVFLILKANYELAKHIQDVRAWTFGIYLSHPIILICLPYVCKHLLGAQANVILATTPLWTSIAIATGGFLLVYLLSIATTRICLANRFLAWAVGNTGRCAA